MGRPSRYAPEVRERAVRMVFEHKPEYNSQWAAIRSIASNSPPRSQTLRIWIGRTSERSACLPSPITEHLRSTTSRTVQQLAGHGAMVQRGGRASTLCLLPSES